MNNSTHYGKLDKAVAIRFILVIGMILGAVSSVRAWLPAESDLSLTTAQMVISGPGRDRRQLWPVLAHSEWVSGSRVWLLLHRVSQPSPGAAPILCRVRVAHPDAYGHVYSYPYSYIHAVSAAHEYAGSSPVQPAHRFAVGVQVADKQVRGASRDFGAGR